MAPETNQVPRETVVIVECESGREYRWHGARTVNVYANGVEIDVFGIDGADTYAEPSDVLDSIRKRESCARGEHETIVDGYCTYCGEPVEKDDSRVAGTYSRVSPDADFIGAGDDVVVLSQDGRSIVAEGVFVDAVGDDAMVRVGDDWQELSLTRIAHPDSPQVEAVAMFGDDLEQEARDLALNDCQIWDNLSESAKSHYRRAAADENGEPCWAVIDAAEIGSLMEVTLHGGATAHGFLAESDSHGFTLLIGDDETARIFTYGDEIGEVGAVEVVESI